MVTIDISPLAAQDAMAKCLQSLANHRVIWSTYTMFVQLDTLASICTVVKFGRGVLQKLILKFTFDHKILIYTE